MTTPTPVDVRGIIVAWAHWAVVNKARIIYSEGNKRMSGIGKPGILPVTADCSAAVTLWYNWAGAADPNGKGYNHTGYTGTLLSHGQHIAANVVVPGDVVVYGPGTGWHTGIVVQAQGLDILTVSHGQTGDPSYVWVNKPTHLPQAGHGFDGRKPQTFLRFNTIAVNPVHTPAP